jgi:hypothetical protein
MGIIGSSSKSEGKYMDLVSKVRTFVETERKRREEWERKAYVNVMHREGHHWVNDVGIPDLRDPNQLRRHVNKFKSTLRALKNAVAFNDPMVDIVPDMGNHVDQREIDLASALIKTEFRLAGEEEEGMSDLIRVLIDDAACKSFAFLSVLPNDNPDDNRINDIAVHDPFDVFFDKKNFRQAKLIVTSSVETKEWLKENGFENVDGAQTRAGDVSHSALKNEFERVQARNPDLMVDSLLVDNVFYVGKPEKDDGEKSDGEEKSEEEEGVYYCAISGNSLLKAPVLLKGYKNLSQIFFIYEMEKNMHVKYPTPWMSDVIPLQRSLNDASENIDTILHLIAKVRFLQRAGASNTLQLIGDKHFQKIRYEGEKPSFMEMPNPPESLFTQVQVRSAQIEDMVGMHSASMGKSPEDRASGRLAAVLQAGDADNVAEPTRNLQSFLSRVFTQILENAADNIREVTIIHGDDGQEFRAVSEDVIENAVKKTKEGEEAPLAIRRFRNLRTVVIPGNLSSVAHSRAEILELMPILVNAGLVEESKALFNVLMRMYAVGTARDIAKAVEREKEDEFAENADTNIIRLEIEKMGRGEPVTATPEQPHELHVQIKLAALQEIVRKYGKDSDIFQIFMQNILQHQAYLEGTKPVKPVMAIAGTEAAL